MTPNDPYYVISYQFDLIGDIESIWDDFDGSGIKVGVYDDGIDYLHEDLAGNYDATLHFEYWGSEHDPFPQTGENGHGTAVAGIIGAVGNNATGGTGVAFGASLTGIDFLEEIQYSTNSAVMTDSLRHAEVFDVMSNSWGREPVFASWNNGNDQTTFVSSQIEAYDHVAQNGRGGLGTIIAQAAGNDSTNANGDSANSTRFTVSVGATDQNGDIAYYSNYGTNILVSAPASNLTTDMTGADGYRSGDYMQGFGGTSAATPVVSGVVALMLEAAPNLGWRDVQDILARSAAHTGSNFGDSAFQFEVSDWFGNGATTWNGGAMSYSNSYGYGMVDAFAAVRLAEVWNQIYTVSATSTNEQVLSLTGGPMTLTDGAVMSDVISSAAGMDVEHIDVTINIDHSRGGDLTFELISPDGAVFELFDREMGWNGAATSQSFEFDTEWTFGVVAARGISSLGDWTLRVTDALGGGVGTLFGWGLEFYGRAQTLATVYDYSQDFLNYLAAEPDRIDIVDVNGGSDWIQMASLTGNVNANLATGVFVDSVAWANLNGSVENIVSGDGNDSLTGTAAANTLIAGRGQDTLLGGFGDDVLSGGLGGDVLDGGDGFDVAAYGTALSGVVADLIFLAQNSGDASGDVYVGIEGLVGSDHADTLRGTYGGDLLDGGAGADELFGRAGNDTLKGGFGDDFLRGGVGADRLEGGPGIDFADYAQSAAGLVVDYLYLGQNTGEAAGDSYAGMEGIYGSAHADTLRGTYGNDWIDGGAGADELFGRAGDDVISGGAGDDFLRGGVGADTLEGGSGFDFADYAQSAIGLVVDFLYLGQNTGEAAGDAYIGMEGIYGSTHNDTLRGTYNGDTIEGGAGDDLIMGRAGDDHLTGGLGDDLLIGGPGADVFIFADGHDEIADFGVGDQIGFDTSSWAGTGWDIPAILATATTSPGALTLTFDAQNTLTLTNISDITQINENLFIV